jgi:hypothetical protein
MALWGKTDAPVSRPNWVNVGQIKKVSVTNGGTGYTSATVSIAAPASGVQATGTAVLSGGVITSITITNPGSGYVAGDAATITITGDGTLAAATAVKAPVEYAASDVVFVDATESAIASNKARGITCAGWWLVKQYTDASGASRNKSECLVAMAVTAVAAGDQADDTRAADVLETITITVQPTDETTDSGEATFSVTATVDQSGTITYQWQKRTAGGTRFTNVAGATAGVLALTGLIAANDGDSYRVKINTSKGAAEVISDSADVIFGD